MKLRLRENSLRLRLLRSEVDRLVRTERVEEVITFAPGLQLRYRLIVTGGAVICATIEGAVITVELPAPVARQFAASELTTIEHKQAIGPDEALTILIEKDFVCLDRKDDPDQADAYPHPTNACE
jgi:hypothetical protein